MIRFLKRMLDVAAVAVPLAYAIVILSMLTTSTAVAQSSAGIDIAPVDISSIIESVGGWAVVAILLGKLIFNDMAHLNKAVIEMGKDIKILVRLTAKVAGKDPDIIEAGMRSGQDEPPAA